MKIKELEYVILVDEKVTKTVIREIKDNKIKSVKGGEKNVIGSKEFPNPGKFFQLNDESPRGLFDGAPRGKTVSFFATETNGFRDFSSV